MFVCPCRHLRICSLRTIELLYGLLYYGRWWDCSWLWWHSEHAKYLALNQRILGRNCTKWLIKRYHNYIGYGRHTIDWCMSRLPQNFMGLQLAYGIFGSNWLPYLVRLWHQKGWFRTPLNWHQASSSCWWDARQNPRHQPLHSGCIVKLNRSMLHYVHASLPGCLLWYQRVLVVDPRWK